MDIHKIGHCCLVLETHEIRILTDPGGFTTGQREVSGVDVVLITHEHGDHLHTGSLRRVMQNNPGATIICNTSVNAILEKEGYSPRIVEGTDATQVNGVSIEAIDSTHEEIYNDFNRVQNTGYIIDDTLFYPGDSFEYIPNRSVDVLALPVAGPWCRIGDAIRYARAVKPTKAFPVHDGMEKEENAGALYRVPGQFLAEDGIEFIELKAGEDIEIERSVT